MKLFATLFIVGTLAGQDLERARKVLGEGAHAKDGDLRRETAVAMSLLPAKDPAAALIDALLDDKDYQVRVAAVETVGEWNDKGRLTPLTAKLNDEVPEVAFAAAKALYSQKSPQGRDALQAVYEGEMKAKSSFLKKEMMNSLRKLKTPKSAFLLTVRYGIGFMPVPGIGAGYGALVGILTDAEFSARAVSLLLVCGEKSKVCDEMLAAAYGDEDWSVRAAGVHVAAAIRLPAASPRLETLLADKKDKVRLSAAAVLLRIGMVKPLRPPVLKPAAAKPPPPLQPAVVAPLKR